MLRVDRHEKLSGQFDAFAIESRHMLLRDLDGHSLFDLALQPRASKTLVAACSGRVSVHSVWSQGVPEKDSIRGYTEMCYVADRQCLHIQQGLAEPC